MLTKEEVIKEIQKWAKENGGRTPSAIKFEEITGIGPYEKMNGYGYHEVVILKSHTKPLSDYSNEEMAFLLQSLQKRYRKLAEDKKIKHILFIKIY